MAVLETFNDNGTIQFSSEALTYSFLEKYTVTTAHQIQDIGPILGPAYLVYIGCPGSAQDDQGLTDFLVAFRSETNTPVFAAPQGNGIIVFSRDPATVELFLFGATRELVDVSANGLGLQLFDAAGDLIYDSNFVPLRGVRYDDSPSLANGASTAVSGLSSERTYAWINTGTLRRLAAAYNPSAPFSSYPWNYPITYPGVRRTSATAFAIEPVSRGTAASAPWWNPPPPSSGGSNGGILTVDVTGLSSSGVSLSTSPAGPTVALTAPSRSRTVIMSVTGGTASAYDWVLEDANSGVFSLTGKSGNQVTINASASGFPIPQVTLRGFAWVDGIRRSMKLTVLSN